MKKRYSRVRSMKQLKFYGLAWLILVIGVQAIWILGHQYQAPILMQIPSAKAQTIPDTKIDLTIGTIREVTAYNSFENQTARAAVFRCGRVFSGGWQQWREH